MSQFNSIHNIDTERAILAFDQSNTSAFLEAVKCSEEALFGTIHFLLRTLVLFPDRVSATGIWLKLLTHIEGKEQIYNQCYFDFNNTKTGKVAGNSTLLLLNILSDRENEISITNIISILTEYKSIGNINTNKGATTAFSWGLTNHYSEKVMFHFAELFEEKFDKNLEEIAEWWYSNSETVYTPLYHLCELHFNTLREAEIRNLQASVSILKSNGNMYMKPVYDRMDQLDSKQEITRKLLVRATETAHSAALKVDQSNDRIINLNQKYVSLYEQMNSLEEQNSNHISSIDDLQSKLLSNLQNEIAEMHTNNNIQFEVYKNDMKEMKLSYEAIIRELKQDIQDLNDSTI